MKGPEGFLLTIFVEISDIIYLFMDSGKDISLNILKREIYYGEELPFYLNIPNIYKYNKGELVIKNIESGLVSSIRLNKIKKNEKDIKYISQLEVGCGIRRNAAPCPSPAGSFCPPSEVDGRIKSFPISLA